MKRRKSKSPGGPDRDPVLDIFFAMKKTRGAIALLKEDRTYGQARELLPRLGMKMMHPDLRLAISGNVKSTKWDQVIVRPFLPRSKDWLQELGWLAHGFLAEAPRLNSFLRLRREFGRSYLLGEYATANATLNAIRHEFGLSLWLVEREFMLLQMSAGFQAHKQRLSEIQAEVTNSLISYIITTCSNRLEPHVTHEAFVRTTRDILDDIRKDGRNSFASWIELHTAPWSFGWLQDKHEMLQRCGGKTLVDRYDRVIKILSCIRVSALNANERALLFAILRDLASTIEDRQLQHLLGMLQPSVIPVDLRTEQYFEAVDALVAGHFAECARLAESLALADPSCFQFLWLLARASASSAKPIVVHIQEHSVAKAIFNQLHQVALNRVSIGLPLVELNITALKLGDNHLGLSLRQFSQFEECGLCDPCLSNQLTIQSKIDACSIFESRDSVVAIGGIGTTLSAHKKYVCVQLELYGTGDQTAELPKVGVTEVFAAIAKAKRLAVEKRHSEVLKTLEPLMDAESARSSNEIHVHGGIFARLQLEALVGLNQPERAAREVIRQYTENPNNLRHVPYEQLIQGCLDGRWPSLRSLPSWPILIFLNNGSEQDLYEAVDDVLIEHRRSSPLNIADGTIACEPDELRIILRDILVPQVIARGALWNCTAEERRQMRKHLLQKLYALAPSDQALVLDELSNIEQAQLLETAYRNIEGPKFELNYSAVNRDLTKHLEGAFARYCEFRIFEEKGGALANEEELLTSAREGTEVRAPEGRKIETSSILLLQIVRAAFVHYLLDTSTGINAFLGTRIRHGSLENQITRVLGAHALLALKNATGEYVCDSSIVDQLQDFQEPNRGAAIKAYANFTQTINSIVGNLVAVVLRIRVPEHVLTFIERQGQKATELRSDQGILDFSGLFSEDLALELEGKAFSSFSSLLSLAEDIFVAQANAAFAVAREYFERSVAGQIQEALQLLENAIEDALPESTQRAALKAQVLAAKGGYAEDLKIIAMWFSAAKPTEEGLGSLKKIVLMAVRVVNFASNGKLGSIRFGDFADEKPSPDAGRLMYEVISILLRNVTQHSRVECGQEISFEHIVDAKCCRLVLRNKVFDEDECRILIERAKKAIAMPFDEWALGTAPGGTGFVRIRKLLKQAGFLQVEFNVRPLTSPCRFETQIDYSK